VSFAVAVSLILSDAQAQTVGTTKIIVPSTPGGGADVVARLLADQISRTQNATIIVENRPGGGNVVGIEAVARSVPDGNTILLSTPEFVINPHFRKQNYDPLKSFQSVCYLARSPQIVVVHPSSPYKTFEDLIADARQHPGKLTLASTSPSSSPYIAFETLKRAAKVDIVYVPFQGATPAVNALLGNQITSALVSYPNVLAQIGAGQLRALAVTSKERIGDIPNVPTVEESGFPGFNAYLWFGAEVPAGTPAKSIARISAWFKAALDVPDVKDKLKSVGLFAVGTCGSEYSKFIQDEFEKYGTQIREANIDGK
jgi:tripartite-type tricarboxylate transporter receptor subunit TctC